MEPYFSAQLPVKGQQRNFHFDKTELPGQFQVTVAGDQSVPAFLMYMDGEGIWNFRDRSLPAWLRELEMELGDIIEDHEV